MITGASRDVKGVGRKRDALMVGMIAEAKETVVSEVVVVIRPTFMRLLDGDACRAAVFNHFLYWIGRKALGSPLQRDGSVDLDRVEWWDTYEEITKGLAGAWGICKVRKEIRNLTQSMLFETVGSGTADRTKHYKFTYKCGEVLRQLCEEKGICLRHLDLPIEIRNLLKVSNATDESIKCNCYMNQMQMIRKVSSITKITTKILNLDSQPRESITSLGDVAIATITPAALAPEKVEIEKLSTKQVTRVEKPTSSQDSAPEMVLQSEATPAPSAKVAKAAKQATAKNSKRPDIILTVEQEARATSLRAQMREIRKYNTLAAGVQIQENKDARKLVRDFTDEQVSGLIQRLLTNPFVKWSKEENRFKLTATVLWQEMGPYLANLEAGSTPKAVTSKGKKNGVTALPVDNTDDVADECYPTDEKKKQLRAAALEAAKQKTEEVSSNEW